MQITDDTDTTRNRVSHSLKRAAMTTDARHTSRTPNLGLEIADRAGNRERIKGITWAVVSNRTLIEFIGAVIARWTPVQNMDLNVGL